MIVKKHIYGVVEEILRDTGFFLVDIQVSRGNLIQVFLDHADGINLDQCAEFSKKIEDTLSRNEEDYELQVSSPGLGQPIRVIQQYRKAIGQKLEILLNDGEKIRGILESVSEAAPEQEPALILRLSGIRRKPAPDQPVVIEIKSIDSARIEIEFKQV
ncbi:MAG: ribosome assembly cofactor RimP [Bacteroidota bacterium]